MSKKAFITGVNGQDGAWLAKLLLDKGYKVYGGVRRGSKRDLTNLKFVGVEKEVELVEFELGEYSNIFDVVNKFQFDEFYNLAAQSFVGVSFEQPLYVGEVNGMAVARLLEAIREVNPEIKFYQASTSEMFGKVMQIPQNEETPFYPRSPYGVSKLYAHWLTVNFRESFNMFACSGILFNHESPLRGPEFVTRKITIQLAKLSQNQTDKPLELGNLSSNRDWGFAGDYVEGMWKMLQHEHPDTYVLATNDTHSIREFVEAAGKIAGFDIVWKGEGLNETGICRKTGRTLVKVNPKFFRPAEVDHLIGNPEKAKAILGWNPKINFASLAELMMKADIEKAQKGVL